MAVPKNTTQNWFEDENYEDFFLSQAQIKGFEPTKKVPSKNQIISSTRFSESVFL